MAETEASNRTAVLIVRGGEHQMIIISRKHHSIPRSMMQSRPINEQALLQSLVRLVKLEVFRISGNTYSHNKKAKISNSK